MERATSIREARRLARLAVVMNDRKKLAALVGEDKAGRYIEEQRDVASKVHRSPPPSLNGMRFG